MEYVFIAIFFLVLIPLALYLIFAPVIRERRISGGIRNQDILSQNYLFKVNYSKQEFLRRLKISNIYDLLDYSFDEGTMIITFSRYTAQVPYIVSITEAENVSYIRLTSKTLITAKSNIPSYINEFMIKKFDALLLPYEEYKNIVT